MTTATKAAPRNGAAIPGKGTRRTVELAPCEDRLLVEPLAAETETAGGIVIPDTAQEKPRRGKVLAVGPGTRLETGVYVPVAIPVGAVVWFDQFAGGELTVNDAAVRLIREADVWAVERSA
jgi:chaperonin GroES